MANEATESVMGTNRLEAFSDGVIAIIITIMVLELKPPHHDATMHALIERMPVFLSYLLSFVYVGIYWNNHHHLLHVTPHVRGGMLWANLHLLFWLSLIPFTTAWMDENHFAPAPTAVYGFVLLMCGVAYFILQWAILRVIGKQSLLGQALGRDWKGKLSVAAYAVAVASSFVHVIVAHVIYVAIAAMWLVPDRRIEKRLAA